MPIFDESYELLVATSGSAVNALTGDVADIIGRVFTPEELSRGDSELLAASTLFDDNGIFWAYELNGNFQISGGTLNIFVGSAGADVIDLTGSDGGYVPSGPLLRINGGLNDDVLWAGNRSSVINGEFNNAGSFEGGNDHIIGSRFFDTISGDSSSASGTVVAGDDSIKGLRGNDTLIGDVEIYTGSSFEGGNDDIRGGNGNDLIFGDIASVSGSGINVTGSDNLRGGKGDDQLFGDAATAEADGAERLQMIAANDTLNGGDGNDILVGDFAELDGSVSFVAGSDRLIGGAGNDTLTGDVGSDNTSIVVSKDFASDKFIFRNLGFGDDTITDFATIEEIGASDADIIQISSSITDIAGLDSNNDLFVDDADNNAMVVGNDLVITPTGIGGDGTITVSDVISISVDQFVIA